MSNYCKLIALNKEQSIMEYDFMMEMAVEAWMESTHDALQT